MQLCTPIPSEMLAFELNADNFWKVSLLFSLEDTASVISDKNVKCTEDDEIFNDFAIWCWQTLFLKYSTVFFSRFFTDWRASAHLYFWATLPLLDIPFIANHVTDLMLINLISC